MFWLKDRPVGIMPLFTVDKITKKDPLIPPTPMVSTTDLSHLRQELPEVFKLAGIRKNMDEEELGSIIVEPRAVGGTTMMGFNGAGDGDNMVWS